MDFDFWVLIAGVGIFLLGVHMMEESLKIISGKAFKKLIRKYTSNTFKAISTGTFSTAILQSSSAVSLMVLAFVGAGIISMTNAIGVILGSNLGTTLTSWIIAAIGFKFEIESFALPLVGIGGLGLIFLGKSQKWSNISKLLAGFGFLFMGLDYMKTSVEQFSEMFDLSVFQDYGVLVFMLIGFVLTVVVQSSSGAMAIILTAVFGGVIDFMSATSMVIGANMGTTVTIIIGSIGGVVSKKRVAASHLIFNFTTGIIALAVLTPLNYFILDILNLKSDPVVALALFHTLFNLMGVFAFAPFVKQLAKFTTKIIKDKGRYQSKYVHHAIVEVPEAGLEVVKKESIYLAHLTMVHNLKTFDLEIDLILSHQEMVDQNVSNKSTQSIYNTLKSIQSEIFVFSSKLQTFEMTEKEAEILTGYLHAVRYCMASCKTLKDVNHEFEKMGDSENQFVVDFYKDLRRKMMHMYQLFDQILDRSDNIDIEAQVKSSIESLNVDDNKFLRSLTTSINKYHLNETSIATLLTANRNFLGSLRQMKAAITDLTLSRETLEKMESDQSDRAQVD